MHITDPIADMLTRIRNANSAKHSTVDVPASNMKKAIAKILLDEGYIKNYQLIDDGTQAMHGTVRSVLNGMVVGVSEGFTKELQVNGIGYRVAKEGKKLVMNIGYSHPVVMEEEEGITIEVPEPNKILIKGCDKQQVGQFAAVVRGKRPPEPYKGKGIKYADEVIRRKEGKTGAKK